MMSIFVDSDFAAPPLHSAEQHESIHGQLTPVPLDSPDYIPPV